MTTVTIGAMFDAYADPDTRKPARVGVITCGTDTPLPDDTVVWQSGEDKRAKTIARNNDGCYDGSVRQFRGYSFGRARVALYYQRQRVTHIEMGLQPGTYDVYVSLDCLLAGPDDEIAIRPRKRKKTTAPA